MTTQELAEIKTLRDKIYELNKKIKQLEWDLAYAKGNIREYVVREATAEEKCQ